MAREKFVNPTREQFKELMAMDYNGPIMMINLLKFKKEGGREAYGRYEEGCREPLQRVGGKIATKPGEWLMTLVGDEKWDLFFVAEYPSIDAFIELQRDKEYLAAVPHRNEAVEDSRLIAVKAG